MKKLLPVLILALLLSVALFSCDKECDHSYGEVELVTKAPTCTENGAGEVKCSKCQSTKEIWIDALGHDYEQDYWSWSDDKESASLSFKCSREGCEATSGSYATISETVTAEADCENAGSKTVLATVERDGVTYTDTQVVEIPASGHDYASDGKCKNCEGACPHTNAVSKSLNLADKDFCVSSYGYLECPDCEKQFDLNDGASLCLLDSNGVCKKCGLKYTYTAVSEEKTDCSSSTTYLTKISKEGVIYLNAESKKSAEFHTYITKTLQLDSTCLNYIKIKECAKCEKKLLDSIVELGCDKHIMPSSVSTEIGGVNHDITEIDCDDCALKFVIDTADLSTQCAIFVKTTLKIYNDGALLCELNTLDAPVREYHTLTKNHFFRNEDAKTCLDGALCVESCSNCDYASAYIVEEHRDLIESKIDTSSLEGMCEGHIGKQQCGACGVITRVDVITDCNWYYDESQMPPMGGIDSTTERYCTKCPLKRTVTSTFPMDLCAHPTISTLSFNEVEIISYNEPSIYHLDLKNAGNKIGKSEKCGVSWESNYCANCDFGSTKVLVSTCEPTQKTFFNPGDYINSATGYAEILSCGCGSIKQISFSDDFTFSSFIKAEDKANNKITYTSPDLNVVITITTVTEDGKPACDNSLIKYCDIVVNNDYNYISGAILSSGGASESHTNKLLGMYSKDNNCQKGAYIFEKCTVCNEITVTKTTSHNTYKVHEYREFPSEFCQKHYVEFYSCACGAQNSTSLDYENLSHNGAHFECLECGYFLTDHQETLEEDCFTITKTNYNLMFGAAPFYEYAIENKKEYHSYTAEIIEKSEECVRVVSKCSECNKVTSANDVYFFTTTLGTVYSSYYHKMELCFDEGGTRYIWSKGNISTAADLYEFDGYTYTKVAASYGYNEFENFVLEYDFKAGVKYLLVPRGMETSYALDMTVIVSENSRDYFSNTGVTSYFTCESDDYNYRIIYCLSQGTFVSIERSKK